MPGLWCWMTYPLVHGSGSSTSQCTVCLGTLLKAYAYKHHGLDITAECIDEAHKHAPFSTPGVPWLQVHKILLEIVSQAGSQAPSLIRFPPMRTEVRMDSVSCYAPNIDDPSCQTPHSLFLPLPPQSASHAFGFPCVSGPGPLLLLLSEAPFLASPSNTALRHISASLSYKPLPLPPCPCVCPCMQLVFHYFAGPGPVPCGGT